MALHKGKPSGVDKSKDESSGMLSDFRPSQEEKHEKTSGKYMEDDEKIAGNVRVKHPNRNVDKDDATNAGGYKN